ncbi:hypothetical protein [Mangrovivirga cuniculi]|nr:hypothetical protein [Mangrovivirga cuniculi]
MKKISVYVFLLAIGMLIQSCSEDSDPNLAQVSLDMKAETTESTINGRQINSELVFNEVLVGVTEVEFETFEEDELEDIEGEVEDEDVEFEGQFVADLINGTSTPDFGMASLSPGTYEELEIEMEPFLDGGFSIFISFEFVNNNDEVITAEYGNSDELEFEIENENGFIIDAGTTNQMLVLLNLDALFAGVDLNSAESDNDGVVRINNTSNSDLAATISSNLDQILEAGEDDDDDGDIDDD